MTSVAGRPVLEGNYCGKWQMGLGTKLHDECISDLQELRWKVENPLADRLEF
jgi:hypothetical protein